jgi:hypothetical protein
MKLKAFVSPFINKLIALISLIILTNLSFAQVVNKDFIDVVHDWKKDTTVRAEKEMEVGKNYLTILPIVGYGPAFGFLAGGAVSFTKLLGQAPTKASSALANFQVTTKKQFILNVRSKLYLDQNKWFLQGDWRLLLYNQLTYGIGINLTEADKGLPNASADGSTEIIGESMKFKQIRFFEDVAHQLGNSNFYAGLGIAVDQYFGIDDQLLDTVANSPNYFITSHYSYSGEKKFDPRQYGTNGFKITILTDTRDNIANAYGGYYASLSLVNNLKIGNNSKQSTQLHYDGRYYLGVNKDRPRQVMAFWSYGLFLLAGEIPYLALPSIGWDTYNRSGRGYIQGRHRGLNMVYNEAEYRFPVTKNGLIGGTVFVNTTNMSSQTQNLFERTAIGYGLGFRMQVDKLARTNLTIDFASDGRHLDGIYFNLQEAF